ncbi:unnamed protein product [Mytilus edulis]|uniref:Uncharacterized protein n=1 Tax=Mytilus edulis TaxID=6550 RepID=A0A8S3RSM9_MYTED|nr:unnamed protein product [Mytilus edulis]
MNKAYREIERVCKADEDLYLPGGIISCDDVSSVIKQLKRRKACGNDMIQNEHLIYGGPKVSECLSFFLNIVVEKQQVPSDWQKGLVVPLFKGGDKSKLSPDSYRPVCLLSKLEAFPACSPMSINDKTESLVDSQIEGCADRLHWSKGIFENVYRTGKKTCCD